MGMKNTKESYGCVAQAFHWGLALLLIGALGVGLYMSDLEPDPFKFKLYGLHKAVGVLILALAALRLAWRFMNIVPPPLPHHKNWEVILARVVHYALYGLMLAIPLSGWAMSSAGGHPVSFFGLFELPPLVGKDRELGEEIAEIHETLAWTLVGVAALHIAGALKHHFVDRDGIMRRMLPSCCGSCSVTGKE